MVESIRRRTNDAGDEYPINILLKAILLQFSINRKKNFLFKELNTIVGMDDGFIRELEKWRRNPPDEETVRAAVDFAVRECIRIIHRLNQYIDISEDDRKKLACIYRSTWDRLVANQDPVRMLLRVHHRKISDWLKKHYPDRLVSELLDVKIIHPLPCEEYSPKFQLNLLGIDTNRIKPPVLDIGCGGKGALVHYLRRNAVEARGIDRMIETDSPFLQEVNWFDYEFKRESWGTVISNMALSNNFRFVMVNDKRHVQRYLFLYQSILESLKKGGIFYYAPAIAPIERLPRRYKYRITMIPVGNGLHATRIEKPSI